MALRCRPPLWYNAGCIKSNAPSCNGGSRNASSAASGRLFMLTIVLKFKDKTLKTIETDKDVITIGRNPTNDIHIDNLSVSKQHARIIKDKGVYLVEDLKSTNGTYLNEKIVSRAEIQHNDTVTIGKHTIEIRLDKMFAIDTGTSQEGIDDTMMLTTEKHKEMLKKQNLKKK
jgi:pSer/pThr/pTyr-binding forkhead associated (FHA) protein